MKKKIMKFFSGAVRFILNPRLLLCVAVAWLITNGWSYIFLALGTLLRVKWMTIVGGAYLTFLWLPISPEKIVTVAIAIFLLKLWFPHDKATLKVLVRFGTGIKDELKRKRAKRKESSVSLELEDSVMRFSTSPYLPGWEYIPDAEPHIFNDRLYIFGSHDRFDGDEFCLNDYVCWSAPLNDLSDFRFEGEIYKKTQDPDNADGRLPMWAPDICMGADGRYYLYYCLACHNKISVAVCDAPAGKYEFLGYVRYADGTVFGTSDSDNFPFDPAIFVDADGRVHLYLGSAPVNESDAKADSGKRKKTALHMELELDMLTVKGEIRDIIPNVADSKGTGFEGHEFFEASSMRRFGDKYYFIYSSVRLHELCYAVSDFPDRGFEFGGVLISNGDVFERDDVRVLSCSEGDPHLKNYIGNNHGSVISVNGEYYVFYHRHTNRHQLSRQACVARIEMTPDGRFKQACMTSCGLSDGLPMGERIEARVACELYLEGVGATVSDPTAQNDAHPCFTQDTPDGDEGVQYISNLRNGACAEYKYFDGSHISCVEITYRGRGSGEMHIAINGMLAGQTTLPKSTEWGTVCVPVMFENLKIERITLSLAYRGEGYVDIRDITVR